jgi:hypothetical protein
MSDEQDDARAGEIKHVSEYVRGVIKQLEEIPARRCAVCEVALTSATVEKDLNTLSVNGKAGFVCTRCWNEAMRQRRMGVIELELADIGVPRRFRIFSRQTWRGPWPGVLDGWHGEPPADIVYVWGPAGTGKTHLATAAIRELVIEGRECRWIDAQAMIANLQDDLDHAGDFHHRLSVVPFLVLDDLGNERQTDYARDRISLLLRNRYSGCRATIITANASPEELVGWDARLVSRLASGVILHMTGEDMRMAGVDV